MSESDSRIEHDPEVVLIVKSCTMSYNDFVCALCGYTLDVSTIGDNKIVVFPCRFCFTYRHGRKKKESKKNEDMSKMQKKSTAQGKIT